MSRLAPLTAYLPWHARDAAWRALAPLIIAAGVIGIPVYSFLFAPGRAGVTDPRGADMAMNIYNGGVPLALVLGAIILMNQVIALDREKQHFRFLLAHPVMPWAFYLQRFAVGLALYVAAAGVIPLVFSALVLDVPVLAVIKSAALFGLLIGSLAMLCGVLINKDGLLLIVVYVVSAMMYDLRKAGVLTSWLEDLARALPPVGLASEMRGQWMSGGAVDSSELLFVVAYAGGTLALALYLVKRLPLAR